MHRNTTGVAARNGQLIAHNELIDNTRGIDINGDQDVQVFSNTLVGTSGTNVRLTNAASQVEIRNNILVTDSGYNLYVDNNSTSGFFSDYNNLTAGPTGKLVFWTKDFTDILDWQEDVYQFDLNSSGTTVVNPRAAAPRFVSRSLNDYRVFDLTARLRFTSPTIDVGDARVAEASAPGLVNLLVNPASSKVSVDGPLHLQRAISAQQVPVPMLEVTTSAAALGRRSRWNKRSIWFPLATCGQH